MKKEAERKAKEREREVRMKHPQYMHDNIHICLFLCVIVQIGGGATFRRGKKSTRKDPTRRRRSKGT